MRFLPFAAVMLGLAGPAAYAQSVQVFPDIDQLAHEPDAYVTKNSKRANESVTLNRAGVSISITRRDGKTSTAAVDRSGHGAVLCTWAIYIELRSSLDICFKGKHAGLRDELDGATGSMNRFISTNSLVPLSHDAVAAAAAARSDFLRAEAASVLPSHSPQLCQSPDVSRMITGMAQAPHAEMQKGITELLSVPRPPAMDPCR